jgi:type I restriction enzyme M protein
MDFTSYLDGYSDNVKEILKKFKFYAQIETMSEANILGPVIEKFVSPTVNLSPYPVLDDSGGVRLPGLDNHTMGTIFEELIRRFSEENNEEAGEHFTPRDVVELMADLVFQPIAEQIKDSTYSVYDGASGTGGMLTVSQERLLRLAEESGKDVSIYLFGQEINPETYAITCADMLLKGEGKEVEHIAYGSTLSEDQFSDKDFDFMLSNPPYGKSWKNDAERLGTKGGVMDSRFTRTLGGVELSMLPRVSDGQLLFLLNNVSKMKETTELGSRIVEVHNGSSLFTGDAGGGESNARRYMIERDLVEAIIALPENMFYNTGIGTFIWVLSNRKENRRRGKIQLIDATGLKAPLRKNLGKKNCEFSVEIRRQILEMYTGMQENEYSKIFDNAEFGYYRITVERPLRLRVDLKRSIPGDLLKVNELIEVKRGLGSLPVGVPLDDWTGFAKATKLKAALLKKIRPYITLKDETSQPVIGESDVDLRDTEQIPLKYAGGIESFFRNEILPFASDAWVDTGKTQIGYELSFTKYFYKAVELRSLSEIVSDLRVLEGETAGLLSEILEGGER